MKLWLAGLAFLLFVAALSGQTPAPQARRVVILKIDGLNADLLESFIDEHDPATGKSRLPWFSRIFRENGTVFENFYVRGISLSAPSWSILDTGHHTVIRGNVEYDRYTGRIYDYLNFFPFYLNYARNRQVDMPAVEVLDRAGIPLIIDAFPYDKEFQSFQLLQRGVRWQTLSAVLKRRVKSQILWTPVEGMGPTSLDKLLGRQTEAELARGIANPEILYLDFFDGDVDHEAHATNQRAALGDTLGRLDALAGRIWTAIQNSPLAQQTVFVAVSDHGMNNRPEVFSQGFGLPDFFNSPEGGAHHVITNRHQLSDYKLRGLDPLVQRVITPSTASSYLSGQAAHYPTAWLDLDGNERAAVQLRNSDLNKIHILLLQLKGSGLPPAVRAAAARCIQEIIDRNREHWTQTANQLGQELDALKASIRERKAEVGESPSKWNSEEQPQGQDKAIRRRRRDLTLWGRESEGYTNFLHHLRALLAFHADPVKPFRGSIEDLIPEMTLGDNNGVAELQAYVTGPGKNGLVLDARGNLDDEQSFQHINYLPLLINQVVRNSPQSLLSPHPVDFVTLRLEDDSFSQHEPAAKHAYWLYGGEDAQLLILTDASGRIALRPVARLKPAGEHKVDWIPISFGPGLPLKLVEDPALDIPRGEDRASWLCGWHTEKEWMLATHRCLYSIGVIGVIEELSPVADNVPGVPGTNPLLLRYERRRRELVQADFHVFAASGWNFNARNFNPGGNHGSFYRISTHSVWMMAGAGLPARKILEPYDSLSFASTILSLVGKSAPMPDRIVHLR